MRSRHLNTLPLLAGLALVQPAAPRAEAISFVQLPAPAGTAQLVLPAEGHAPAPLVLVMPDALGEEGRAEAYVVALAARGIATLVVGLDGDPELPQPPRDRASEAAVVAVAQAWALGQAGLRAEGRIGVLGFGAGARGALAAPAAGPTVALYPGCAGLELPTWRPVLVLQGDDAPDAPACAALEEPPAASIQALRGAGHAWDARPGAEGRGDRIPAPDGEGRVLAKPDAQATARAAVLVAGWFTQQFGLGRAVRP
jgi:dienelactone hydrolase